MSVAVSVLGVRIHGAEFPKMMQPLSGLWGFWRWLTQGSDGKRRNLATLNDFHNFRMVEMREPWAK